MYVCLYVHTYVYCVSCVFQCVVQSYLKWLEDSDYDPACIFCAHSLEEGEAVRLVCFGECMCDQGEGTRHCTWVLASTAR